MKAIALFLISAGLIFGLASDVQSQAQQSPQGHLQQLQAIQAHNAQLLEKQTATLQKLEEMRVQAQQLKSFTKRS